MPRIFYLLESVGGQASYTKIIEEKLPARDFVWYEAV
jgi:hypothetical protein